MLWWRQKFSGWPAVLLLWIALAAPVFPQAPAPSAGASSLVPEAADPDTVAAQVRRKWELEGVDSAIQSGFPGVALTLTERLLQQPGLPPETMTRLLNARIEIAMIRGNLATAAEVRARLGQEGLPVDPLLDAFLAFFQGDLVQAQAVLAALDRSGLRPDRQAWALLLEALLLGRQGNGEAVNEAFARAEAAAPSAPLRDAFEIVRLRQEMAAGVVDEATVSALRESIRSMWGERGGFEAARLLAIALSRSGDTAGAIDLLNSQLALPGLREFNLRADFLLLLGTIAGPGSVRGRLALRELVAGEGSLEQQSVALTLLVQAVAEPRDREALLADIGRWLESEPPHPLADRLLACQAYFLTLQSAFVRAEEVARDLLDRFPASPYGVDALRLLAYASWSQTPPRYRTAADYLNRLRQLVPGGTEAFEAGVLIADCYFLNGDYASASDAYGAMLKDSPPGRAAAVFFQRILSEIGAGRPDLAAAYIDAGRRDERIDQETLWRADWNLLDYLRRSGRTGEAFERINRILASADAGQPAVPVTLSVRFRWLQARLTLESGKPAEAAAMAAGLLEEIAAGSVAGLPTGELEEVNSHLLLLRGEAEIASGNRDAGLATFARLREAHPRSGPAILSYLVESRSEAAGDNLVSAQQSLIALVDRFPASEYAPIALWEAALNAEQRGLNIHLQEAIGILERLVNDYPEHDLVYFARLKQGDLARRLNDFPTALLLYERLLALYPDHPQRFRAEMSRGDCLMALGSEDVARFDLAAVIYERNCLLPAAPLPIRVEAGFKWAHSLRQQGDLSGCEAVYWLVYERFILDRDIGQALVHEEAGRYWAARILMELAALQAGKGEAAAAIRVYEVLLQMNLPGSTLAKTRMDALRQNGT